MIKKIEGRIPGGRQPIVCAGEEEEAYPRMAAFLLAMTPIAVLVASAVPSLIESVMRQCGDRLEEGIAEAQKELLRGVGEATGRPMRE